LKKYIQNAAKICLTICTTSFAQKGQSGIEAEAIFFSLLKAQFYVYAGRTLFNNIRDFFVKKSQHTASPGLEFGLALLW
jgi:hypothetical protein